MAHANMDYHMDFFSLLTLAHDLGEPKSENYTKSTFTTTPHVSQNSEAAPHLHNHHHQQAEALSSSNCTATGPTDCSKQIVNDCFRYQNGFEAHPGSCGRQGTKRSRVLDQFLTPQAEATDFPDECSVSKVCSL